MKRRAFGSTGADVPVVGLGTWQMEDGDVAASIAALRRGIDLGLSHIDTAEMYGSGVVEEAVVGPAIAGRRDEVFLVSKVLPANASRKGTIAACERSLKRLKTDRLDLYLLHWPGDHPIAGTMAAFEELLAAGKIRFAGVSNFDVEEFEEAKAAATFPLACNQVVYHLEERAIEHRVLPQCRKENAALVAYSPFGSRGGFPKPGSAGGAVLKEIADAHRVSPRTIALAFLARDPHVFVIPKTSNAAHVDDLAATDRVTLSKDELARIDAAFPRGKLPRTLPSI